MKTAHRLTFALIGQHFSTIGLTVLLEQTHYSLSVVDDLFPVANACLRFITQTGRARYGELLESGRGLGALEEVFAGLGISVVARSGALEAAAVAIAIVSVVAGFVVGRRKGRHLVDRGVRFAWWLSRALEDLFSVAKNVVESADQGELLTANSTEIVSLDGPYHGAAESHFHHVLSLLLD